MTEIINAIFTLATALIALFAFWYTYIGQWSIIEKMPSSWTKHPDKTIDHVRFYIVNRRMHAVYIVKQEIIIAGSKITVLKNCLVKDLKCGASVSEGKLDFTYSSHLTAGEMVEFQADIQTSEKTDGPLLGYRPISSFRIQCRLRENTPLVRRYIISDIE
ncbi:hypothetical protein H1W37_12450 [Stappia taiwanensis]|uniref:Uncharacterized protein n=1 Tax=Stappia taiwanensis TaxID=992267 RepID=A0A838Y0H3_9HYPH|nr:hypothetical protein [Stappia taiwanensis]MBA4612470.1 hypothetical protein [Stappia taiwanensis]GGF05616.1 hypothetical protein GCM10007285_36850 [Stappia taiwanensis]